MNILELAEIQKKKDTIFPKQNCKIQITKNGPYIVSGGIPLLKMTIQSDSKAIPTNWLIGEKLQTPENYALCRCGKSKNAPFCDGTHLKVKFDGKEKSNIEPFEKLAKEIVGSSLILKDAEILCASARFCHRGGDIWQVIHKSDEPWAKENAIENACDCPSGRLVIIDKISGEMIEPSFEKSIGLIEDPAIGVNGPIWVRGKIPIYSSEGKLYEVRNRVTICRCGNSTIKPFCDSSHYPEENRER